MFGIGDKNNKRTPDKNENKTNESKALNEKNPNLGFFPGERARALCSVVRVPFQNINPNLGIPREVYVCPDIEGEVFSGSYSIPRPKPIRPNRPEEKEVIKTPPDLTKGNITSGGVVFKPFVMS